MPKTHPNSYTTFDGHRRIALWRVVSQRLLAAKRALERVNQRVPSSFLMTLTGRSVDVDALRGTEEEVLRASQAWRLLMQNPMTIKTRIQKASSPRGRGRPQVRGRCPWQYLASRHWDWLAESRPGGASVILRKLVEEARRATVRKTSSAWRRNAPITSWKPSAATFPGFEEAHPGAIR